VLAGGVMVAGVALIAGLTGMAPMLCQRGAVSSQRDNSLLVEPPVGRH
jgi:hypothetical protein